MVRCCSDDDATEGEGGVGLMVILAVGVKVMMLLCCEVKKGL